jgi:hypothetical protein
MIQSCAKMPNFRNSQQNCTQNLRYYSKNNEMAKLSHSASFNNDRWVQITNIAL